MAQIKRSEKATCRTVQMLLDIYLNRQDKKHESGVPVADALDELWAANYDNLGNR